MYIRVSAEESRIKLVGYGDTQRDCESRNFLARSRTRSWNLLQWLLVQQILHISWWRTFVPRRIIWLERDIFMEKMRKTRTKIDDGDEDEVDGTEGDTYVPRIVRPLLHHKQVEPKERTAKFGVSHQNWSRRDFVLNSQATTEGKVGLIACSIVYNDSSVKVLLVSTISRLVSQSCPERKFSPRPARFKKVVCSACSGYSLIKVTDDQLFGNPELSECGYWWTILGW